MLQMIKKFRFSLLITTIFISTPIIATENIAQLRTKVFLYQSKLPKSLVNSKDELRRHVIDVLLSTQKYNVVFSKIPEFIAKGDVPQVVLKYKLRTSTTVSSLFNIEFKLINADTVKVIKTINYVDIPKSRLFYQFRLHLYEFILGKKLTNAQEMKFNKVSSSKIKKFKINKKSTANPDDTEKNNTSPRQIKSSKKAVAVTNTPPPFMNKGLAATSSPKAAPTPSSKKITLWDLLKDNDQDRSWLSETVSDKSLLNKETDDQKKEKGAETQQVDSKIVGPANPFLKTRVTIKEDETQDIRFDMFHIAWRVVKRDQEVTDLVGLTNNFFSVLGLTFEWVIHNPLNIKNLYFRTGFEVDKSLKTEPIKLSDHSLFRAGFGVKLPLNILPSLYIETNSLVFANLNRAGEGFQDNIVSVYWSTLELAILTKSLYLGAQYSKSIDSSTLLEGINFANLQGERFGATARYFSNLSIFSLKLWTDVEYRVEHFSANNLELIDRKLNIVKKEIAVKFGVYF